MQEDISLIERLYASVLEPGGLSAVLGDLTRLFGASHAFLAGYDLREEAQQPWGVAYGMDPSDLVRFTSQDAADLAQPIMVRMPVGLPVAITDLYTADQWERHDYYDTIVRPMNGFDALSVLDADQVTPFHLVICRGKRDVAYGMQEKRRLGNLLPHVRTVLEIARRIQAGAGAGLHCLIDAIDQPIIVTDAAGVPRLVNRAAAAEQDRGLMLRRTVLAATPQETDRLLAQIAEVAISTNGTSRTSFVRGIHGNVLLRMLRLPAQALSDGSGRPHVAIFIKDLDRPSCVKAALLAQVFDLTPREAEIAGAISGGRSLREIADQLSIGLGTVRAHLKSIFIKTNTRSQAALVARLLSVAF